MADVKCPMCGKANPADAEVCEFCQARIKPLLAGSTPAPSDPGDWLSGLRLSGDDEPKAEEPAAPESSEDESTDWLSRIRARHQAEAPAEEPALENEESVSDWLAGLRQDGEEPAPTPADSLSSLFADETSPQPPSAEDSSPPTLPATEGDNDLGWLSAFQADSLSSTDITAETPPQPGEPTPGLLNDLGWLSDQPEDQPAAANSQEEDGLDWLSAFQSETPAAGQSSSPAAEEPSAEPLDEISPMIPPASPGAREGDLDWLSAFQAQSPAEESPTESAESSPDAPPEMDWLAGLAAAEPEESPAAETPVFDGSGRLPEDDTYIQMPDPDALPDWLLELQKPAPTAQPAGPAADSPPDWLNDLGSETREPEVSAQPSSPYRSEDTTPPVTPSQSLVLPGQEMPDWLRDLGGDADEPEVPPGPFSIPVPDGTAPPVSPSQSLTAPGQGIPDWLTNIIPEDTSPLPSAPAFLPDDQLAPAAPESTIHLFGGKDLPEWIGEGTTPESDETPANEAPAVELEPAQLPTWLQTMRPVEAAAPNLPTTLPEDNRVENAGPLAGLRGLVSGSETVTQYRKPPLYSIKLQVSERQRLHANLLENILNSESQAATPPKEALLSAGKIMRALVTLLLLAALLTPLILQMPAVLPARNPNQLADFASALGEINPGDAILLAVEYEPGLAAELEAASNGLLQLLDQKNARLSLISTNPVGPALGEALLASSWPEVKIQTSSANLGYLAGGSTALAQLATTSLLQHIGLDTLAVKPYRQPADWATTGSFSDFKAVILLTDNVETGRAWVEQIRPALNETPLLIISSSQAAPMLQAYTGSQVKGLLSGSSDAVSSRLAAYQIGMLMAAILILIGVVGQGIILLIKRPRKPHEG